MSMRSTGRLRPLLGLVSMALVLAPAAAAAAKSPPPPEPQLDTATATGKVDGLLSNLDVDVQSGPSGENPGGSVSFTTFFEFRGEKIPIDVAGPATCLDVTGNTAAITFLWGGTFYLGPSIVWLVDNGGSGLDEFGAQASGAPADCSQAIFSASPLNGRAVVFDAQPLPTTAADCRNGGWQQFGFKNQGQCVASVKPGVIERPFKGKTSGTFPPHQPGIVEGTFQATQIGKGTYFSDNTSVTESGTTLSYSGDLVITAANGDELFVSGTGSGARSAGCFGGPGECVATLTITDTITGGTGRFEGAGGSYVSEVRGVPDAAGGYVTTSRIEGTISY